MRIKPKSALLCANGDCDCGGNVLDECGVCGGTGIPNGDCDCNGNVLDECGVCNGPGIPAGFPAGKCDCNGGTACLAINGGTLYTQAQLDAAVAAVTASNFSKTQLMDAYREYCE